MSQIKYFPLQLHDRYLSVTLEIGPHYETISFSAFIYHKIINKDIEMFYLNSTLNFGILPVLVFQSEVYYKVHKLLAGLTA